MAILTIKKTSSYKKDRKYRAWDVVSLVFLGMAPVGDWVLQAWARSACLASWKMERSTRSNPSTGMLGRLM